MYRNLLKQRYRLVFGYIGNLFVFFPLVMMLPVLYCIWYPSVFVDSLPFLEAAVICFALAYCSSSS
jgi:trk system potassium uptake protein TrkH